MGCWGDSTNPPGQKPLGLRLGGGDGIPGGVFLSRWIIVREVVVVVARALSTSASSPSRGGRRRNHPTRHSQSPRITSTNPRAVLLTMFSTPTECHN